jgi:hypothetical protein
MDVHFSAHDKLDIKSPRYFGLTLKYRGFISWIGQTKAENYRPLAFDWRIYRLIGPKNCNRALVPELPG